MNIVVLLLVSILIILEVVLILILMERKKKDNFLNTIKEIATNINCSFDKEKLKMEGKYLGRYLVIDSLKIADKTFTRIKVRHFNQTNGFTLYKEKPAEIKETLPELEEVELEELDKEYVIKGRDAKKIIDTNTIKLIKNLNNPYIEITIGEALFLEQGLISNKNYLVSVIRILYNILGNLET